MKSLDSDKSEISFTSKTKNSEQTNTVPIKVVGSEKLHNQVAIGSGLCTAIVAILDIDNKYGGAKRALRVLLDSGSDGDLVFVKKGSRLKVPYKERYAAQTWRTSNGTFKTTNVAKLDVCFPEFSTSKRVKFTPDVVSIPEDAPNPTYDLIIGVESLVKIGGILDFSNQEVTIDGLKIPMRPKSELKIKEINLQFRKELEPISTREATHRLEEILDAEYLKADIPEIVNENCQHLTELQRRQLIKLLTEFESLFDGTLGDWKTTPVSFELKEGAKPFHARRAFPVPKVYYETLRKEVDRLCEIGVLKRQPESEWASNTFIIPKKNKQVRFISDFREVNRLLVRKPFPIPKISTVLQEMEGFTYATQLDLNMGYYTVRLDGDAQRICTIILPWGKYSYLRLPMGIAGSPDIFQEKMSGLMESLEYVRTYLDDLLVITKSSYGDHLEKLRVVLTKLQDANLKVNAAKSTFAMAEVEYLGYILSREGIKPMPEKVSAILAINPPTNVRELRKFLGMVQYYRDMWVRRSHVLAPLANLVGECGHTKVTKKNGTKRKPWHWDKEHQIAFDDIKSIIAKETLLAYPDYSQGFDIHTDASKLQLGAVISQGGRPIAFFSRKLSEAQRKYTVTELELLSIVECLKEFRGMLWGQRIKVFTDHKNLIRDALGLQSERVHRWRLLLEEYDPTIEYLPGTENVVADALSRMEYDPTKNVKDLSAHERMQGLAAFFADCDRECSVHERMWSEEPDTCLFYDDCDIPAECYATVSTAMQDTILNVFATQSGIEDEEIYPVTISQIASEQRLDKKLNRYFDKFEKNIKEGRHKCDKRISLKVIDDQDVLVYDGTRLVVPAALTSQVIQWYHHYLMHPGADRLERTIAAALYWRSLRVDARMHTKTCQKCQKANKRKLQYGKLPPKIAEVTPWRSVCVDLIGPYTLRGKDGTILDFMCLTMIDPATSWFEIVELPLTSVTYVRKGEEIAEIIIDKSSAQVARLFNKQWLSRYPRAKNVLYDNGSEFKLHFRDLCTSYGLKHKPTSVKNPQSNAVLERIHAVFANMLRTAALDMADTVTPDMVDEFLTNAAWAIRSTHHTVLGATPGAAIFGRDMLFDIPYLADWNSIGQRRQQLVDRQNAIENSRRIDFDYTVGQKVLLRKDGIIRKASLRNEGPYVVTQVFTNGTVRIQRGTISERLNIRRISPFFE